MIKADLEADEVVDVLSPHVVDQGYFAGASWRAGS